MIPIPRPSPPAANSPARLVFPVCAAAVCLLFFAPGNVPAQSSQDLEIPGLTTPDPAAPPPVEVAKDGAVTQSDTSLLGLIASGGWSMWVLGAFSMALAGLAVFCIIDLRERNFCPPDLADALRREMGSANLAGIHSAIENNPTTLARMTSAVAEHVAETGYSTEDNELLRDMMAEAGQRHNRQRAKVINYFSVLAQAAPMMGLLGTVSGMIKAFGTLQTQGMGNPNELAGHISEALVTTAAGLVIALPAIFLYFYFRDRLEEFITRCEDFGVDMLKDLRRAAYAAAEGENESGT